MAVVFVHVYGSSSDNCSYALPNDMPGSIAVAVI